MPIDHTDDLEKPNGAAYGKALKGFGVNLLVRDVLASVAFQVEVLGVEQIYSNADFAILRYGSMEWMLHVDGTYHSNPLLALTGDGSVRGVGVELRLYDIDPDAAVERAKARGDHVLGDAADKPHGLREAYILDPDGYCWVPGRALVAAGE
ncbi:MAG: glyoxalase [Rhodospirillaceae bacterium]|jgi:catechol 2,3-dioxygenase-like lactoylglutathione lyase family enzyme|nr:glyoxalase [Rhodospirillaceae bacterium]